MNQAYTLVIWTGWGPPPTQLVLILSFVSTIIIIKHSNFLFAIEFFIFYVIQLLSTTTINIRVQDFIFAFVT